MTRAPGRRGEAGFTLAEVLVALALLAVAALLAARAFATDQGALRRIEARVQGSDEVAAAQASVRARLRQLYPGTRYDRSGAFAAVSGWPDKLEFMAPEPAGPVRGRVDVWRLDLSPDGRLRLNGGLTGDEPDGEAALLTGVSRLELAYYGLAGATGASVAATPGWTDRWSRRLAPPRLIRVRVAFAPGDRRRWPDLLVAPAATVDSDCQFDQIEGGCRGRR